MHSHKVNGATTGKPRLKSNHPDFRRQMAREMANERRSDFILRYNDPVEAEASARRLERIIAEPVEIPENIF
jgi:hypothetical protein